MFKWVLNFWYAMQRQIDLKILWPSCKEQTPNLDHAKGAFAVHAFRDPAWLALGNDRIVEFIDELE
jgi:hypothetical protein